MDKSNKKDNKFKHEDFIKKNYDAIKIGNSDNNNKIINLNKIYPYNSTIYFIHKYKDTFHYKIYNNKLSITRTDEKKGWGQNLVGFIKPTKNSYIYNKYEIILF